MNPRTRAFALAVLLCLGAPAAAVGDPPPEAGALDSYRQAFDAVARAARALGGGEGVEGLAAVSFSLELTGLAPYQSPTPEPPYLEVPVVLEVDAAPGERWARVATTVRFPEAELRTVRVLGPGGTVEVDPDSGRATAADLDWDDLERDFRRSPQLVVRDAWERRRDLRWLGTATVDGAAADLVAFPFFGRRQLTVAIDGEGRVLRHEFLVDDLRTGDAAVVARFLDYRREDGRWLPQRFEQWEGGVATSHGTYTRMAVGEEPVAEAFIVDAPPEAAGARGAGANPGVAGGSRPTELAPGVYLVRRLQGQDYNSLIVDLGSCLAVVEAPLGDEAARELLAATRAAAPTKPVCYVVASHHHADHSGGVPHLVAATGAAVVTTPGNAEFFRTATAARRTLAEPQLDPAGPAELVLVEEGELRLPGERTLRLLDVGPTAHAREILVAWLPEPGLVFQGDLIRFPDDGPVEPAREQARRLAESLDDRGLEPARIVGVHGRVGTLAELREAIDAGEE